MLWPVVETLPMPLTPVDAAELRTYQATIDDARAAGLECWLAQCANLTLPPSLGDRPELLVRAWQCLRLELDALPADLGGTPAASRWPSWAAPPANQVDSQRRLLVATATVPAIADHAGVPLAEAAAACYAWWDRHGSVGAGGPGSGFGWGLVPGPQRSRLANLVRVTAGRAARCHHRRSRAALRRGERTGVDSAAQLIGEVIPR